MSSSIPVRAADDSTYDVDPGHGWIMFAAIMLMIVGIINLVYGIAAIGNATFYAAGAKFVFGNLHTWGWLLTIVGGIQVIVAFGVWAGTEWGRWLGIAAAALNMVLQFFALPSHPTQSVLAFFVDVIIVWGLLTYGGHNRDSWAG